MQDYEITAHIEQWKKKQQRIDHQLATLISAVGNLIYGSQGVRVNLKPGDFLSTPQKSSVMTEEMLFKAAVLAFGLPPKSKK